MKSLDNLHYDGDSGREVMDVALQRKHQASNPPASNQKIYPVEKDDKSLSKFNNLPETTATSRTKLILLRAIVGMAVCACLGWTLWLILLNVAPNDTVNRVMNTENFDYGSFWLMVDPSKTMVGFATFGLSVVAIGYIGVLIKMITSHRSSKSHYVVSQSKNKNLMDKFEKALQNTIDNRTGSRVTSATAKFASSLIRKDSAAGKRVKLLLKFGDLFLETLLLYQMLEGGSPAPLIAIFTLVVAMNALSCAAMMYVPHERAPLAETMIDILFDFLIIVGCPMLVIVYCLSSFTFDRAKFAINLEVFPIGWFEQGASVIADAEQIGVIYESLKSLRITTPLNLFSRIGVNITLCIRLWKLVDNHLFAASLSQESSVYPKRHHFGAAFLLLYALMLVIFVEECMRTSSLACQSHPECVVNARRWTILENNSLTQCPCLMLIDRDVAPKTYAEWENPINVTDKVAQLASTGDLHTLQLTNRYMADFPDELRRCKGLRHLTLEYTHTQTFPPWMKEFKKLEFLHVESKFTSPMVVLPDDMFDDMSSLTAIHLAAFIPMAKLPSFEGLTNLKSLTLAVFLLLEEIPSFDTLHNLERLVLSCVPAISGLPDFSPIRNLKSFASSDRGAWCCNGFLGNCDLSNPNCGVHPLWGSPAVTCLDQHYPKNVATPATRAAVEKFDATTCGPILQPGVLEGPPTPDIMAPCNGTMYHQCGNAQAMCYNARYMAIACTANPYPIEMRRRQIARGIGDPCDPEVEAWLGCKK
ncbi:putative leucine-rich repeat domain superfamily [Plasmopara halstedii]